MCTCHSYLLCISLLLDVLPSSIPNCTAHDAQIEEQVSRRSSSTARSGSVATTAGPGRKVQVFEQPVVVYAPPQYRNRGKPAGGESSPVGSCVSCIAKSCVVWLMAALLFTCTPACSRLTPLSYLSFSLPFSLSPLPPPPSPSHPFCRPRVCVCCCVLGSSSATRGGNVPQDNAHRPRVGVSQGASQGAGKGSTATGGRAAAEAAHRGADEASGRRARGVPMLCAVAPCFSFAHMSRHARLCLYTHRCTCACSPESRP